MITITEIIRVHRVRPELLDELQQLGLLRVQPEPEPCIEDEQLETLERMLRLHRDLGVNPAGIETIQHMRLRVEALQRRVRELEAEVKGLRARALPIEEIEGDHVGEK